MKKLEDLRVIFMGTPDFAVASLQALLNAGCDVVGVVTAPDKPGGRGMQLQASAVKKFAEGKGLKILQPEKLRNEIFLEELRSLKADVQVVVAFRMLPEIVWNMPPMGTINLHGSLLPQYRGAAPINWAILNGEIETGVTTFQLQQQIDTGGILLQEKICIGAEENAGSLHDRMMNVGADLIVKTMEKIAADRIAPIPQQEVENENLKKAPKIFTETCQINWKDSVERNHNLIRGLSPYPAAFTYLDDKKLKIFKAEKIESETSVSAGGYVTDGKTYLHFASGNGYMDLKELQLEGKKRMDVADFLRGYKFT